MKLLFDQNVSHRLVDMLADAFPDSTHVRLVGLERASDEIVWEHAKTNGYTIVSKDSDFHQRSFVRGAPPKIVWIRRGNCSTSEIASLLRNSQKALTEFLADAEATFLELG